MCDTPIFDELMNDRLVKVQKPRTFVRQVLWYLFRR